MTCRPIRPSWAWSGTTVAPHLALVNGALAELVWSAASMSLTQSLT